ncbi:flavin reductase family protein [Nocardioides sp. QY071]|uniref:flavin reductase family protein n=1 Tax=Nocardioides sp. QY071 TaxID=3044187 RepID=UPI00249B5BAC|nr:flavin reductase family protein [Nocardioides sp. QY071]WGY00354.1 flavin reductase family protein [Nocardioides sp. QY071]
MQTHTLAADSLRTAYSAFPTGVVAVCGIDRTGAPAGMAISSFVPISLDPPLVGISLQKSSRTWPGLRSIPVLGISVLSAHHADVARRLAAKEGDRFAGLATSVTDRGAVLIDGAAATFECRLVEEVEAGDHVIAMLGLEVVRSDSAAAPLLFHLSRFVELGLPESV